MNNNCYTLRMTDDFDVGDIRILHSGIVWSIARIFKSSCNKSAYSLGLAYQRDAHVLLIPSLNPIGFTFYPILTLRLFVNYYRNADTFVLIEHPHVRGRGTISA